MKTKIIFLLCIMPVTLCAQISGDTTAPIETCNRFFIEAGSGTQVLFSADADKLEFTDRFTPIFYLSGGRWISPLWGANIRIEGFSLNGNTIPSDSLFAQDPVRNYVTIRPDGSYRLFIRYVHSSANVFISTATLIRGKTHSGRFDAVPAAGLGYLQVLPYKGVPSGGSLTFNAGISFLYRPWPCVAFNLSAGTNFMKNGFEGRNAGENNYDSYATWKAGVVYYLK